MSAYVKSGEDPGDPYVPQSGYLPEPGPQGLPHNPAAGEEHADPPQDGPNPSYGPGVDASQSDPTISSISPATGGQGVARSVTITGTGFETSPTVTVSGTGVAVTDVVRVSATSITATLTQTGGATVGARTVTVKNVDLGEATTTYTVGAAPTLTSVTPDTGAQGAAVPVTLAGTNFVATPTISVSGTGVSVSSIVRVSATEVTATFTATGGATISDRNVTITNPDGGTATLNATYNVTAP